MTQSNQADVYTFDCVRDFYMPYPEGSHGEGIYFRQYLDCSTGEVTGTATRGAGCVTDEEQDCPDAP